MNIFTLLPLLNHTNTNTDISAPIKSSILMSYINLDELKRTSINFKYSDLLNRLFGDNYSLDFLDHNQKDDFNSFLQENKLSFEELFSLKPPKKFIVQKAFVGDSVFVLRHENTEIIGDIYEVVHCLVDSVLVVSKYGEIEQLKDFDYVTSTSVDLFFKELNEKRNQKTIESRLETWEEDGLSINEIHHYLGIVNDSNLSFQEIEKKLTDLYTPKHRTYFDIGFAYYDYIKNTPEDKLTSFERMKKGFYFPA